MKSGEIELKKHIENLLKDKILDKGKCICDFCGRKAKLGAMGFDPKTGEILVMCLSCNLEDIAEREGITKTEAKKRRKKRFAVLYLFQEVKMKEYLALKGKDAIDSKEKFISLSESIRKAWNDLTAEERIGFEDKSEDQLKEIYKGIKVDFP